MQKLNERWQEWYGNITSEEVVEIDRDERIPLFVVAYNVGEDVAQHIVQLHNDDLRRRGKL